VRMPRICSNAATIAERLEAHPKVERVYHTSLASHPDHAVAQRLLSKGTGMIAFVVKGGDEAALSFMRSLEIVYEATSLGGVESLIECPFNSSHGAVPEDVRMAAGIVPGFVRLSIGIEDVEDLWNDMEQALA
jgi:cystathionine beta-lyase/cystathionine gamma-synthase